jgi:glycosyltransferase involved in cell wall biosynthesis
MSKPLVSIITPCYNGEKYIPRFVDSILNQTYKNIELIFVNDGSTDATEKLILSYKSRFAMMGIIFKYIYQENKGLAGAINAGLRIFKGEYLCWPDVDDYLEYTSVEKRLSILEKYPEYAVVTSDAYIRNSNNIEVPVGRISDNNPNHFNKNQFQLLIEEKSIFCPGCHMVRSEAFLDTHPDRHIFEARRGQNWQMLLPIYYKYQRYFLDEPLYNYVVNVNSMSRGDDTKEKKVFRCKEHMEILTNTINTIEMSLSENEKYLSLINERYARKLLYVAYEYRDKKLLQEQYKILKISNKAKVEDKLIYARTSLRMLDYVCNFNVFLKGAQTRIGEMLGR